MKTLNKWSTSNCGRRGGRHENYSGKLDADGVEYVVCGQTHKRMNVKDYRSTKGNSFAFPTVWREERI